MSEQKKKAPKVTEVELLKDGHTHAGIERKKGDKIMATDRQIAFLVKRELIAAPKGFSAPTTGSN